MKVRDAMTKFPATCTPEMPIEAAARLMVSADCGAIPVVGELAETPIGIITDRDIVVRAVALGRGPSVHVREVMSTPAITVPEDTSLADCIELLERRKIRRAVVVDSAGRCCGVISQADIVLNVSKRKGGELLKEVSSPSPSPAAR